MDNRKINELLMKIRSKPVHELSESESDAMTLNNNINSGNRDDVLARQMAHQKVRLSLQKMQSEMMEQMEERMSEMVSEVMREVEQTEFATQRNHDTENGKYKNRKKSEKPGGLPDKLFHPRNSLLTDLFEIPHIRTIYNIFIVILIILFLNSFIDDIVAGNLKLSVNFIQWSFGGLLTALVIWVVMIASTIGVYVCFTFWANQRTRLHPLSVAQRLWDYSWLLGFIGYQLCLLYFPVAQLVRHQLPPATAVALLMEQVRLVMKGHAFVRSNTPRVLAHKRHDTSKLSPCPGFSHFLYFLFCPTLVYRDSYPRTKSIRWTFVAWSFLEVIGVVVYMSFIFERFLVPAHRDYGLRPATLEQKIVLIFGAMLPGMLSFLCGFYCLLHSWMNAFAEMTRFADRMFYQDWWNANNYGAYYRRWNVVIHDWLYNYIYKDVCETFCPGNRLIPTLAVFGVSAIVHEYILAFTFGFFYPMLMVTFGGFGLSLVFITSDKTKGGNLLVWLCLSTGTGLLASLYCMEWYARINCAPSTHDAVVDFFVPRSWTCVHP